MGWGACGSNSETFKLKDALIFTWSRGEVGVWRARKPLELLGINNPFIPDKRSGTIVSKSSASDWGNSIAVSFQIDSHQGFL